MYDGHWLGGGFMWVLWILLILVVVWVAKAAVAGNNTREQPHRSPLEVLEDRFARGELDEAEFERKRKMLEDSRR